MPNFAVPKPHELVSPSLPDTDPLIRMGRLYRHLSERVAEHTMSVSYAGDCVSAIGFLSGLQRRGVRPTLIWLDAHGDFNTPQTSPSGFPGGMPLGMITGRGDQTVMDATGLTPLADEQVILIDGRDLDPGEDEAIASSGIRHTTVGALVSAVPAVGPLHIHLDGDVVDPSEMPAMNYPAPGGPSLSLVRTAIAQVVATGRVAGFSISSWNPSLPGAATAAAATRQLVEPFINSRPAATIYDRSGRCRRPERS